MHLVHFASETYGALSDAVDQTEGLAVLGFLFEVRYDYNYIIFIMILVAN